MQGMFRIHHLSILSTLRFPLLVFLAAGLFIQGLQVQPESAARTLAVNRYESILGDVLISLARGQGGTALQQLSTLPGLPQGGLAGFRLDEWSERGTLAVRQAAQASPDTDRTARLQAMEGITVWITGVHQQYPSVDETTCALSLDRLPQALTRSVALLERAIRPGGKFQVGSPEWMELHIEAGAFAASLADIETAIGSVCDRSEDNPLTRAITESIPRYLEAARNGYASLLARTDNVDAMERVRLHDIAVTEASLAWKRLFEARTAVLQNRMEGLQTQKNLYLAGLLLSAALALAMLPGVWGRPSSSQPLLYPLTRFIEELARGENTSVRGLDERLGDTGPLLEAAESLRMRMNELSLRLSEYMATTRTAGSQITHAINEQMATSIETSSSVAEITATMEELSASSTQIAEHSHSVVDIANQTWEGSKKGFEAMQLLMDKMGDIRDDNQKSLNEILGLGGMSKEISQIMKIITSVADQTKLIAFNAALEAASAGESGRRFGVVAAEIRRLADSVTDSTGEIETKVNQIQDSISHLVVVSEKGASGIDAGLSASITAGSMLSDLVDAARQTASAAKQISLSTQQQKTASNQVVVALREIASASSQTGQSIKRIAGISEELVHLTDSLESRLSEANTTDISADSVPAEVA